MKIVVYTALILAVCICVCLGDSVVSTTNKVCTEWSSWSECKGEQCSRGRQHRIQRCNMGVEFKNITQIRRCDVECITTIAPTTISITTSQRPAVNCSRCDFSHGLHFQPDPENCHYYYDCIPEYNHYRSVRMACLGDLYWHQELSTCTTVPVKDGSCDTSGKPYTTVQHSTITYSSCEYQVYPNDNHYYWKGTNDTIVKCGTDHVFDEITCRCVRERIDDNCKSDPMLHFPYDDHFDDVSCNHASSSTYGDRQGVTLQSEGNNKFVCFAGKTNFEVQFMRRWFANRHTQHFTIMLWYKSDSSNAKALHTGLVHNGDCMEKAGFEVGTKSGSIYTAISTDGHERKQSKTIKTNDEWHHLTWVYNGRALITLIDGNVADSVRISGDMANTDAPLTIGKMCKSCFFTGCIDDLKVYSREVEHDEIVKDIEKRINA